MSFFNFRRAGVGATPHAGSNAPAQSLETLRKRAKHRLIGSAVLVLAGVVGFPMLFDTQPRPVSADMPIEIPSKNAVKPLAVPALPASAAAAPNTKSTTQTATQLTAQPAVRAATGLTGEKVTAASSLSAKEEILIEKKPPRQALQPQSAIKIEVKPVQKPEPKPEPKLPKPEIKPEPKPEPKPEQKAKSEPKPEPEPKPKTKPIVLADESARARALLNDQAAAPGGVLPAATDAPQARLVVQVGAFADVDKAKEVRLRLEKAGLKTYTQVTETTSGKRIRVRAGPFASKAEAEKAASKIKALDLPATVLTP